MSRKLPKKTKRKAEWFENESFWKETYPYMFFPERFKIADEQVAKILKLTRFSGKSVLDLCCGPGRLSIPLRKRGFEVTGVDRTKFLLDKAKRFSREKDLKVEWVLKDMRDFKRKNSFDLALNWFTSFGYFDKKKEDLQTLRNIYQSLRPSGILAMDTIGREIMDRVFQPTTSTEEADGTIFVQRHERFDDGTRVRNQWILIKGRRATTLKFHHTIYSGGELKRLLRLAGFKRVRLYGDLEGNPYGPQAKRLIAIAFK
jgi:SAM-dependent methyltransferase